MAPYRDEYDRLCDGIRMRYQETYNASEGFFAVQDLREHDKGMLLLLDAGVFYEFVPLEHCDDPFPPSLTAWQVEAGKTYAMVITAANGLWRYRIGDTVCVTSIDPLRIAIAGRTAHYINAFGEEVMVHNTDAALAAACAATGAGVRDYTVAPVLPTAAIAAAINGWSNGMSRRATSRTSPNASMMHCAASTAITMPSARAISSWTDYPSPWPRLDCLSGGWLQRANSAANARCRD